MANEDRWTDGDALLALWPYTCAHVDALTGNAVLIRPSVLIFTAGGVRGQS
jgi:hypothetical protein